jgi:hypothetical protein
VQIVPFQSRHHSPSFNRPVLAHKLSQFVCRPSISEFRQMPVEKETLPGGWLKHASAFGIRSDSQRPEAQAVCKNYNGRQVGRSVGRSAVVRSISPPVYPSVPLTDFTVRTTLCPGSRQTDKLQHLSVPLFPSRRSFHASVSSYFDARPSSGPA